MFNVYINKTNRINMSIVMDMNATVAMIVSLLNFDSSMYLEENIDSQRCVIEGYFFVII